MKKDCPECKGRGEIYQGTTVLAGEVVEIHMPCLECSGTGEAKEEDDERISR